MLVCTLCINISYFTILLTDLTFSFNAYFNLISYFDLTPFSKRSLIRNGRQSTWLWYRWPVIAKAVTACACGIVRVARLSSLLLADSRRVCESRRSKSVALENKHSSLSKQLLGTSLLPRVQSLLSLFHTFHPTPFRPRRVLFFSPVFIFTQRTQSVKLEVDVCRDS